MAAQGDIYFVSDVHLGLGTKDPAEREARFLSFLKAIPRDRTRALYLLGDIWDFWYEYHDVVPRVGARVVAALIALMDDGVDVWFCPGNHDVWTYSFFEELGMHRFDQPYHVRIDGKDFCLGHGDLLGGARWNYKLMLNIFHCRPLQRLFSTLHPWLGFRIGQGWSNSNRPKLVRGGGGVQPCGLLCVRALPRRRGPHASVGVPAVRPEGLVRRGDALRGVQRFFL